MTDEFPYFKFHPELLVTGMIVKGKAICSVCEETRGYIYQGPFYSEADVKGICPWCISDGSAAKKYAGEFQNSDSIEGVIDTKDEDELVHRTPGYNGWQQEKWLVHCKTPCAYLGYVGWGEIKEYESELQDDIKRLAGNYNMAIGEFSQHLIDNGSIQGYLFKCVRCGQRRLTTDCD